MLAATLCLSAATATVSYAQNPGEVGGAPISEITTVADASGAPAADSTTPPPGTKGASPETFEYQRASYIGLPVASTGHHVVPRCTRTIIDRCIEIR